MSVTYYFRLQNARSYRFYKVPTLGTVEMKAGQVLRVTTAPVAAYFRAKGDVVVECGEDGQPLLARQAAVAAKSFRTWKKDAPVGRPQAAHPQDKAVGTRVGGARPMHPGASGDPVPTSAPAPAAARQQPVGTRKVGGAPVAVGAAASSSLKALMAQSQGIPRAGEAEAVLQRAGLAAERRESPIEYARVQSGGSAAV